MDKDKFELKPCPFCGAEPKCGVDFYESYGGIVSLKAVVKCPSCACAISISKVFKATDGMNLVPFYTFIDKFEEVVKKWSTMSDNV